VYRNYTAKLAVNKNITGTRLATYTAGLNTHLDKIALGLNMDYTHHGGVTAKFTASTSFGRNPRTGDFFVSGRQVAKQGGMAAKVFLDNNDNGIFDEDVDEPLENVRLTTNGSVSKTQSDKDGNILVTGIQAYRNVDLALEKRSLEDPAWLANPAGVRIYPRPGVIDTIDFPIIVSGEIDSTVFRKKGKWASEVSDAVLQLLNEKGDVVRETKSAFDGFYLFDYVRPGKYTLRVSPDQLARLNIPQPPDQQIEIKSDGTILNGRDFVLSAEPTKSVYRLLLAVFNEEKAAKDAWPQMTKAMPDIFNNAQRQIDTITRGTDSIFELYATGLDDRSTAEDMCKAVRITMGLSWCNPMRIQVQ